MVSFNHYAGQMFRSRPTLQGDPGRMKLIESGEEDPETHEPHPVTVASASTAYADDLWRLLAGGPGPRKRVAAES